MNRVTITRLQALDYEVQASWWASWISNDFLQGLAGRYFAWKVNRKMGRIEAQQARWADILRRYPELANLRRESTASDGGNARSAS